MARFWKKKSVFDQQKAHFLAKKKIFSKNKKSIVQSVDNYIWNNWLKFESNRLSRSWDILLTDFENVVSRKTRLEF